MSSVKIDIKEDKLSVETEYSSEFVREAKKLNGKWNGVSWNFDPRDE